MSGAVEISMENWLHGLTPREYQVALLVGRGLSNKGVGRELGVSDRIWPAVAVGLGVLVTAVWIGFLMEMVVNLVSTVIS
jgi:FixJ family two-component response regulator